MLECFCSTRRIQTPGASCWGCAWIKRTARPRKGRYLSRLRKKQAEGSCACPLALGSQNPSSKQEIQPGPQIWSLTHLTDSVGYSSLCHVLALAMVIASSLRHRAPLHSLYNPTPCFQHAPLWQECSCLCVWMCAHTHARACIE